MQRTYIAFGDRQTLREPLAISACISMHNFLPNVPAPDAKHVLVIHTPSVNFPRGMFEIRESFRYAFYVYENRCSIHIFCHGLESTLHVYSNKQTLLTFASTKNSFILETVSQMMVKRSVAKYTRYKQNKMPSATISTSLNMDVIDKISTYDTGYIC